MTPSRPHHGASWRLLVAGLLLAALAGWQGWQCTDGAMTTPLAGHMVGHHQPGPFDHQGHPSDGADVGAACVSVMVTVAATVFALPVPRVAMGSWTVAAPQHTSLRAVSWRAPALAALGVLRI